MEIQITGEDDLAMTTLDQSFSNINHALPTSDSPEMLLRMSVLQTFL